MEVKTVANSLQILKIPNRCRNHSLKFRNRLNISGEWTMIFPTLTTLRSLARYVDVRSLEADVLAWRHLPEITDERHRQGMQHSGR